MRDILSVNILQHDKEQGSANPGVAVTCLIVEHTRSLRIETYQYSRFFDMPMGWQKGVRWLPVS